jgi:hypothetical protein
VYVTVLSIHIVKLGTALFPTKTNLWYGFFTLPFDMVIGKALKNLSD